jgi:hypothetical protein
MNTVSFLSFWTQKPNGLVVLACFTTTLFEAIYTIHFDEFTAAEAALFGARTFHSAKINLSSP